MTGSQHSETCIQDCRHIPVLTSCLLRWLKISTAMPFDLSFKCHVYGANTFPPFPDAKFHSSMSKPLPGAAALFSKGTLSPSLLSSLPPAGPAGGSSRLSNATLPA